MKIYKANIKIKIGSSITTTFVHIEAPNTMIAKAILERQYGKGMVLSVIQK